MNKIALYLPSKTQQHFSIFVIQLLEGNQAMYKPCSSFNDLTLDSSVIFECNGEDNEGLLGEFIYIRDERKDKNKEFKLCEVQIFSEEGITFAFLVKTILISILVESQEGCGELDSIGMGSVRKFEGVAKYQCEEGYRIEAGNDTRFCEDGTWNGTAPVCLGL